MVVVIFKLPSTRSVVRSHCSAKNDAWLPRNIELNEKVRTIMYQIIIKNKLIVLKSQSSIQQTIFVAVLRSV